MFRRTKHRSLLADAIGTSLSGPHDASLEDLDMIRRDIEALRRGIFYRCLAYATAGGALLFGGILLLCLFP